MGNLKKGISVVINTYNAEEHLREVLESAKGFDEILVCDMESTDSTLDIVKEAGCNIVSFKKANHRIVEVARDYAIHSARCEWVLVVDADELISEKLRTAAYKSIESNEAAAYLIPRRNHFMGRFENSFRKDLQLRLFKQEVTNWLPVIHSKPVVQGNIKEIPDSDAVLLHLQDRSISNFIDTYNTYTDYEIEKRISSGRSYSIASLIFKPLFASFKFYILRGGFRDGKRGILHAAIIGTYDLFMVAKIIEIKLRKE